jgi:hypothetical protein
MAKDKKMISLEISDDLREQLRLEAFNRKITISALIRQLIEEALKANKETGDYSILTNSNLLDIRAKYPMAAFNHNLIMEAANGVSMAQVTEHISKTIQGLGTDKTTTQVFGD